MGDLTPGFGPRLLAWLNARVNRLSLHGACPCRKLIFFGLQKSFAGLQKSLFVHRIDRQTSGYGREQILNM